MKKFLLAILMCFAIYGLAIAAVNINTATKEELTSLKGIGEKRAQDIIDYRTKNGPFKSVDDLEKVPGIGPGMMKQIRSQISVTGKTTIDKPASAPAKTPDAKKAESAKGEAMKTEKKAGDAKTVKTAETKKAEPAKGDAMKADKAKEKTAAKPMSDEKAPAKADDKKTEKK
jgi:competence protein ComEA